MLVDEYQDTNAIAVRAAQAAGRRARGRFTAVGDDDQAIYGWRGATIDNLKRLPQDFPQLKVIKLEQNYRSTGAHPARGQQRDRPQPEAVREEAVERARRRRAGARRRMRRRGARGRARGRAHPVARARQTAARHSDWKDFAILYRANHQARVFEQALRKAQIPYKVSGGQSFFDRAEIKDLCAWLRLIVNNDDDPAFLRAVTTPKRGIGHQTLAALGDVRRPVEAEPVRGAVRRRRSARCSARARVGALHEFGRYVNDLEYRARHTTRRRGRARRLLLGWLKDIGYEKHLHDGEDSEKLAAARWTNVLDFVDWIAQALRRRDRERRRRAPSRPRRRACSRWRRPISRDRQPRPSAATTRTSSRCRRCTPPRAWSGRTSMLAGVNEGLLPFKLRRRRRQPTMSEARSGSRKSAA